MTVVNGARFVLPYQTVVDANGVPIPGAQLFFYASGTSTPINTYSDAALTVPNTNPVVANAAGVFPNIFMLPVYYKVVLTDSLGDQIWTADPVFSSGGGTSAPRNQRSIASAADLPILATDSILNIGITVALAITAPLASTRAGAPLTFKNLAASTATVTLSPTAPDEFDALTSVQIAPQQALTIVPANDGVNTGYEIM